MKYLSILALLLAGCSTGYTVAYGPYCGNQDQASVRQFILDCTKANQITATESNSPEDVISTCRSAAEASCPKVWLVRESQGFNWIPCSETGKYLRADPKYKACSEAGWSPFPAEKVVNP